MNDKASGPLKGVKIVEFAGIGPGPFAGMMLSDMGATVLRIDRKNEAAPIAAQVDGRGRRRVALDLKTPEGVETALRFVEKAEIVFEGNRPGVMERLGLGPDVVFARNPSVVYGRMTGWGQYGTYAPTAGHDINYLALTGALHAIGTADRPIPPLNLAADYGGGAMFLLTGMLAALTHARATGEGQVVDAAMTDGAAYLMNLFYGLSSTGFWKDERASNVVDGAAPFYDTYECSDGRWISIGSSEPQFYALLLDKIGATEKLPQGQMDRVAWPEMKAVLQEIFLTRSRDEWCEELEHTDACFAPVLTMTEAPSHPHNQSRQTFVEIDGVTQVTPTPRFSVTPGKIQSPPQPVEEVNVLLAEWGAVPT